MKSKKKFPLGLIVVLILLGLAGTMVYNSGALIKLGWMENPVPQDQVVAEGDPRVVLKKDPAIDQSAIQERLNDLLGLITGKVKEGKFVIFAKDSLKATGVANMTFEIRNMITDEIVDTLTTDETGYAESVPLKYKRGYEIVQIDAAFPYGKSTEAIAIEMKSPIMEYTALQIVPDYIKNYEVGSDGVAKIVETFLPVELIMQKPELPNGCEITSLTSALNFYGYKADKEVLSDEFLAKRPFYRSGGKLYAPHPDDAFSGDPRSPSGFYVFAPPVVDAGNKYVESVGGTHEVMDITGSSREDILSYVEQGKPVVIWVTLGLNPPNFNYHWYIDDTDEYYEAVLNLHCVVINGIKGEEFYVMDPLEGNVFYEVEAFLDSYESLGSRAIIIEEISN